MKNVFICTKDQFWTGFQLNIMIGVFMSGLPGFQGVKPGSGLPIRRPEFKADFHPTRALSRSFRRGFASFVLSIRNHCALARDRRHPAVSPVRNDHKYI